MISIIIPARNEAATISQTLAALSTWQQQGHEVIVVDGGSSDNTAAIAKQQANLVLHSEPGRARQMNTGAAKASGQLLVFLHADTLLPSDALALLGKLSHQAMTWGRFDVELVGRSKWLPVVANLMNLRSRLTSIATGDQALFFSRDLFERLAGFVDQPLMEDIEICRRARVYAKPICFRSRVKTSGRRWDTFGAWPTIRLMWRLRWRYWRGDTPENLAKEYQ
ncbi:MAG: TIGR04283 family arsenosugar biosynthesis glycosyltransferase [Moraxellaceae bacterium]|nr:TIGR04283 family arsenosugar biosynthesis glycosyltransferase [Moraxellaceae bacterium]MDZ4386445.1 TIGR04283 family arsenosugar biosynthesis glycosyltransferase [Moraxellaceae bacterium]